jgi:DNA-binding response OmpR family regulator
MIANTDKDKLIARLLVVDDDPDIVQVLKLALSKNRFLVDAYTNPKEALQNFESNAQSYDLVLSDNWMHSLSGIQLAKKVKEANPNVKVLLLTGVEITDNEFSEAAPSASVVDDFIQKPIRIKDLTNKILSLIGKTEG